MRTILVEQLIPIAELFNEWLGKMALRLSNRDFGYFWLVWHKSSDIIYSINAWYSTQISAFFQEINLIIIQSNLLIIKYMNQDTAIPPRYFTLVSIDTPEHNHVCYEYITGCYANQMIQPKSLSAGGPKSYWDGNQ